MPEFEEWHTSLTNDEQDALDVRLELVSQRAQYLVGLMSIECIDRVITT